MLMIISMGLPKKRPNTKMDGYKFNMAIIQIVDWKRKKITKEITYQSPPENLGNGLSMQFKGAAILNERYYVVTNTEVLCYNLNSWSLEKVISLPSFNDLHGVLPKKDLIYVCNTGLEIIQVINQESQIVDEINLATEPTYERFKKEQDYRLIATTKPHEIHVNHIFSMEGNVWATRGMKADCINIYDFNQRINIGEFFSENISVLCHDGIVRKKYIYFTTVNGHILIADKKKRKIVRDFNVNTISDSGKKLGWVRGLEVIGNHAFLGTTKLRSTSFKEYTNWLLKGKKISMKSSIIQIDMNKKKILDSYVMERYHSHAIFTILKHPE